MYTSVKPLINTHTSFYATEVISKHHITNNKPYQHFQVQDHSESVHHKNWQSNICLNQEYAPKISKQEM